MAVLYLIVCGARPAESTASHAADLIALGWDTCVIATPEGRRFFDAEHVQSLTGHPVRVSYKDPDAEDVLPPPDVLVLAPASFNTVNKLAAGISDTLALGLLNEALGAGLPIIAAPWAKAALRNHPAYPRSVAFLRDAGVALIEGLGKAGEVFPWREVLVALTQERIRLRFGHRERSRSIPERRSPSLIGWMDDEVVTHHPAWMDPETSWWAKANRAKEHLGHLSRLVEDLRASNPYSLTPETDEKPGWLAYRLRFSEPVVSPAINVAIGDVLHNLRTALESLAFEVAQISKGEPLTKVEERNSTFPICKRPDDFERFLRGKGRPQLNGEAQAALRSVQPFANLEQAHKLNVALDETFEEGWGYDHLHRLDILWNIDKHRRLTILGWWPDQIWWGSDGPSNRRIYPGDGTLANGSILFRMEGTDEGYGDEVGHKFSLVLKDDPAYSLAGPKEDVVALLTRWHEHVVFVIQRVFTSMGIEL